MMTKEHRPSSPQSGDLFDELLVVMAQQGDKRALARLYERWNPRLVRAARRYTDASEPAQDLAQECWLAICKRIGKLSDPARFRSYAFAILHRRGADHLKRVVQERERIDQQSDAGSATDARADEGLDLRQAFSALPAEQRLAAHLHFVEGLTLSEIAAVLRIPQGTAKSRLFHARRKLKAALQ